jgi:hypothetical protein
MTAAPMAAILRPMMIAAPSSRRFRVELVETVA